MKSRRIYTVISQFSKETHQQFGEFIRSPFHNGRQILIELWELIERELLADEDADLSPEDFHSLLKPGKAYNYNLLTKNLSRLLSKFHEFLVWNELQNQPEAQEKLLLKAYRGAQITEDLPWLYKKSKKRMQEVEEKSATFYGESFEFEYEMGHFLFGKARNPDDLDDFFKTPNEHLDNYYFIRKLQMATGVLAYNRTFNKSYSVSHLDWVLKEMEAKADQHAEAARIYFNLYGLMKDFENQAQFLELKTIVLNPDLRLNKNEHQSLIALLLNVCFKNTNQGKSAYEIHAENIFDFALETGILLIDEKLHPANFKNIIHLKCALGKIEAAESLLNDYRERLSDQHEGFAVKYNQGQISFAKGDFQECFRQIDEVIGGFKDDVFYSVDGRGQMIKCLFEKARIDVERGDLDFIESSTKNFQQYLDRFKKISESRLLPHLNFAHLIRKLKGHLFQPGRDREAEKGKIRAEIEETKPLSLSNRRWLLKMLEE